MALVGIQSPSHNWEILVAWPVDRRGAQVLTEKREWHCGYSVAPALSVVEQPLYLAWGSLETEDVCCAKQVVGKGGTLGTTERNCGEKVMEVADKSASDDAHRFPRRRIVGGSQTTNG
jgi:hypothetical protein